MKDLRHILGRAFFPGLSLFIPVVLLAMVLSIPLQRQIGLTFRYDLGLVIAATAAGLFLAMYVPGWPGRILVVSLTLVLFALPVAGLWASGQSEQYLLGGILPFSDANSYYNDARRILAGFDYWGSRPLFTGMLVSIFGMVGGNLKIALAVLVGINALAAWIASNEIEKTHGRLAAALLLVMLFLFYRSISGKTLSENFGLSFGCLGFALIWGTTREKKWLQLLAGLFMLTLALNARPGPFFVLPALLIWSGWHFRGNRHYSFRIVLAGCAAIAAGFAINIALFSLFGGGGQPFSSFPHTLYGLARGGLGWQQIYVEHPEVWAMSGAEASQKILQFAWQTIREHPDNLLKGSISSVGMFFSNHPYYSALSFLDSENDIVMAVIRWFLLILSVVGILEWIRQPKNPHLLLIVGVWIGIVLSVPFAPPLDSNRMRVYAVAMPFFFSLPTLGLAGLLRILRLELFLRKPDAAYPSNTAFISSILMFVFFVGGALFFKILPKSTHLQLVSCPPESEDAYVHLFPESFLNIVPQDSLSRDWVPEIRIKYFINRVHNLPNWETFPVFDNIQPGTILINDIDLKSGKQIMVFIADTLVPEGADIIGFCGKFSKDKMVGAYRMFFAEDAKEVSFQ